MTEPQSISSFFSGGGGKSLSWKDVPIGTTYTGVIKAVHPPQQATDPATQQPAFTRQNKPKMQVRIDLATSYRDPQDPEDDGTRSLYVGGWMTGAIGDACRKAGATEGPVVGGTLTVRLIDREAPDRPGLNPTNKYDALYQPGAVAAGFFGGQAPANGMAPLGAPPQQAPAPVPSISGQGYVVPPQQPYNPQPVAQPQYQQQPLAPQPAAVQQPLPPMQAAPAALTPEQVAAQMGGQVVGQQPLAPQPAAGPALVKPDALSEDAWAKMDDATKQNIVNTMAGLPPF